MYEKILVPLDGSELAEQAIPYVEWLARKFNSEVIVITVCFAGDPLERALTEYIERRAEKIQSLGMKARSACIEGEPATSIIDFAGKNDVSLIVISTHGRTGISHWPLGSIANKVVQRSHIPVFLVRSSQPGKTPADKELRKILVTLDGSHFSEAIIPYVEKLAKVMGSEVVLLRVIEPAKLPQLAAYIDREKYEKDFIAKLEREAERYLGKKKTALASKGVKVNSAFLEGKPVETILQYTEDNSVNLIALTTHGFSGITKWAYGSVASRIIEGSSKPTLLVRPPLPALNT
ncbi:MAG: universal stress protein [Chloroflexi bacterium]|jgi:nucleotide-binding universal stress UspA family protein|nr:universal stress protein [Chloroflexota bacterium]